MCLLIANPLGAEISREHLHTAWLGNNHGAGFAFFKEGKLILEKGFFTFDEFYEAYQKTLGFSNICHFRFATSGLKNKENCHPFIVSENEAAEPTLIMGHNGVISTFSHRTKDMSDTFSFIKEILKPLSQDSKDETKWWQNDGIKTLIESCIGTGNKLAMIDYEGEISIFNQNSGQWLNEEKKIWASNGSYITVKDRGNKNISHTPNHNMYYESDYWESLHNQKVMEDNKRKEQSCNIPNAVATATVINKAKASSNIINLFDIPEEELEEVDSYLDELNLTTKS